MRVPRGEGRGLALYLVALLVFGAVGIRWIVAYRHGQPYDIDQSGYQVYALLDFRGLTQHGPSGWVHAVFAPSIQAPLMTAATTPAYAVLGRSPLAALSVPLGFGLATLLLTYLAARAVAGTRAAWLAGLLTAGSAAITGYSRDYTFAIAAAAMLTATVWCLTRSRNLGRWPWSLAAGLFLGLTLLARTMTIALVPGVLLAMVVMVAVNPDRPRRALRFLAALAVAAVTALPWYVANGRAVASYLTSFGYGSHRSEYGTRESLHTPHSYVDTLQYLGGAIYLPLLAALVVGAALTTAVAVRRLADAAGTQEWTLLVLRSPLLAATAVTAEGLLALTSSGNKGSGFATPLLPSAFVVLAWALARSPRRVGGAVGAAAAAIAVVNLVAFADLGSPLATPRGIDVPGLGSLPLLSGRAPIEVYESQRTPALADEARPLPTATGRSWLAADAATAELLRADGANHVLSAWGFRQRLLNVNSVQLAEVLAGGPQLPSVMVDPVEIGDTLAGDLGWLTGRGGAATACNLLTATGSDDEFSPTVDPTTMVDAARLAGFRPTTTRTLPDGRVMTLWRRSAECAGT